MTNRIEIKRMKPDELELGFKKNRITSEKVQEGCRMIFVDGASILKASREAGVDYASMHRASRKLRGLCPCCGQPQKGKVGDE